MDLIVETDVGHDPDDFLAICWLVSHGVNIRGIVVYPGDPQQIAVAMFLCKQLFLNIPVAAAVSGRDKIFGLGVHQDILDAYGATNNQPTGTVDDVFRVFDQYPDCELLSLGPVKASATWLITTEKQLKRATLQGGFLNYNAYRPKVILDKFEGVEACPTFNLNGDRKAGVRFIESNKILEKRFVGKNICHTVTYNKQTHEAFQVKNRADQLFHELMTIYLTRHEEKKLHDPTAAVCHLHPEIALWVEGRPAKSGSGWTTEFVPGNNHVLADIDYEKLFAYLLGNN